MKIALLCNNRLALPALQKLADSKMLCAIGITDMHKDVMTLFSDKAAEFHLPLSVFSKRGRIPAIREWLQNCEADVVFVMTFPWRITTELLAIPRLGFVNFHYGLLPEMRGSDPIFETIRQQMPVAGVTVHKMDEGIDTGSVLLRREMSVPEHCTYGMLSTQLAYMGADLCAELLKEMEGNGELAGIAQDESVARYWPAAGREDIFIRWNDMDSGTIISLVNACNPALRSGAATYINGWGIGICHASPVMLQGDASAYRAGTILTADHQNGMIVYCRDGRGLKLDVVYTEEGFFPGYMLSLFGIVSGMVLN